MLKMNGTQRMTVIRYRSKYILVQDCCYAVSEAVEIERWTQSSPEARIIREQHLISGENSSRDTSMTRFIEVSCRKLYKKKKLLDIPVFLKRFFEDYMCWEQSSTQCWPKLFKQGLETNILHMWYFAFLHDGELPLKN